MAENSEWNTYDGTNDSKVKSSITQVLNFQSKIIQKFYLFYLKIKIMHNVP